MTRIDYEKIRSGRLIRVVNQDPHRLASRVYYHAWLESADKSHRKPYLFTQHELQRASERAGKNQEDIVPRMWWVRMVEWLRR